MIWHIIIIIIMFGKKSHIWIWKDEKVLVYQQCIQAKVFTSFESNATNEVSLKLLDVNFLCFAKYFSLLAWYLLWNTYAKHLCTSCLIEIVDNHMLIEFRIKVIEKCNFLCTKLNSREFFHLIVFFDLRIIFFFSS